ncbi:4-hydroxy-tetrahydrodipicolinate reductase [Polystyrenella longa]|uniref:4-hydroxy-tetrahydrodipicolinate reductase n=1 Tax=Polystyrenella longa TaxID=2528007 RepID=A0A518CPM2_9PLAN|nr:4-hydroxy-tetrahydrodipicolinate reductase [Polystyrenella longa]QDU81144.1 4-hydroxy-tetrahydrodipicolinate reductase [Polystyrenella longa]
MSNLKVAVHGAAGRMGQRVTAVTHADKEAKVAAAIEGKSSPALGKDAGELAGLGKIDVPVTVDIPEDVEVVIDFSVPEALIELVKVCQSRKLPLVIATTGLSPEQKQIVDNAIADIPVVWAPSMSQAVNVTMELTRLASRFLKNVPEGVDVEIIERHHRYKEDAPSGTALRFGEIVSSEMGQTNHQHGREGRPGLRPRDEIGYHALRVGDNVGEHTIVFGMLGETIELSVKGSTRDSYAYGALAAAKFVVKQKPGLYSMNDVLGL